MNLIVISLRSSLLVKHMDLMIFIDVMGSFSKRINCASQVVLYVNFLFKELTVVV